MAGKWAESDRNTTHKRVFQREFSHMGWEEDVVNDTQAVKRFEKVHVDSRNCVLLTFFPTVREFGRLHFATKVCNIFQSRKHTIVNFISVEEGTQLGSSRHLHMAVELAKPISLESLRAYFVQAGMNVDVHGTALYYETYFRYLYCASEHKPIDCIDSNPLMHKNHWDPCDKMKRLREGVGKFKYQHFFNVVVEMSISTVEDLFKVTKTLDRDMQFMITEFLAKGSRNIQDDIDLINKVNGTYLSSPPDRLQTLANSVYLPCLCKGELGRVNDQILNLNSVDIEKFCAAVLESLVKGAKKGINVCIVGESGSGKTSILSSLPLIFGHDRVFTTPVSTTSMPLLTLPRASVCLLNDFRYNPQGKLSWNDLLQWWEGLTFKIGLPRNFSCDDVIYDQAAPVFITTSEKIEHNNPILAGRENLMMEKRLKYFFFLKTIEKPMEKYPACAPCFVKWLARRAKRADLLSKLPEPCPPPQRPEGMSRQKWQSILTSHKKRPAPFSEIVENKKKRTA